MSRLSRGSAFAPITRGAEELEALDRRRIAHRERDDVIVLEVEVRSALDVAATIALLPRQT